MSPPDKPSTLLEKALTGTKVDALSLLAEGQKNAREDQKEQTEVLREILNVSLVHNIDAKSRHAELLKCFSDQEVREAIVASKLARVTSEGKLERFSSLMAILRQLPPPLKKALTDASVNFVFYGGGLIIFVTYVHFKVPTSTIVTVLQAVIQPLVAAPQ